MLGYLMWAVLAIGAALSVRVLLHDLGGALNKLATFYEVRGDE